MDTSNSKKKLSKFSHNSMPTHNINGNNVRRLKSITTQTDESSTYFSQHNINGNTDHHAHSNRYSKSYPNNYANENEKCQKSWGRSHDCLSLCPACSHTMTTYNTQMCQPFSMPWYSTPYGFNSNYLPMGHPPQMQPPPFMPMPILQGVVPYGLPPSMRNSYAPHNPQHINPMRSNYHPEPFRTTIGDNINNHLNYKPHKLHKEKTTNIRSETNMANYYQPQVKQPGKQRETSTNTSNSNSRNLDALSQIDSSKSLHKSDTCIPTTDNRRSKIYTDMNQNINNTKRSYYLNKQNRFGMKGDFNSNTNTNTNRDVLKSSIYKYADLRIHEMSSNLKDIKDNIVKLSSKASELNINDPGAESENNHFSKYFKSVYNELKDKDAMFHSNTSSLRNSMSNLNSNYTSLNSIYKNSTEESVEVHQMPGSLSTVPSVNRDMNNNSSTSNTATYNVSSDSNNECNTPRIEPINELYTNTTSTQINTDKSNDHINEMKRTLPLYDIPSALHNNQVHTQIQPLSDHRNLSSTAVNVDKNKVRRIKSDKIMAHVLVPERQAISGCNLGESMQRDVELSSAQKRKRINKLNRRYANISFINYDSLSDEDPGATNGNHENVEKTNAPSDSDSTGSDKIIVSEKHMSRYFQLHPEGFQAYRELLQIEKNIEENDDEYDEEIEFTVGNAITEMVTINTNKADFNNGKKMTMTIEKWLQKNAESLKNKDKKQIAIITTTSMQPNKRHSQFGALNDLEVLSKISEEDEERFSGIAPDGANVKSISKPNKLVNKDLLHGDSIKMITKATRITEPHMKRVKSDEDVSDRYMEQKLANSWIH